MQTIYAHLDNKQIVELNQEIKQGQKIGYMGNSGSSTGPHLHFQVEVEGSILNPIHLGKYNRFPPQNPRNYLGDIEGNLSTEQEAVYCDFEGGGGVDNDNPWGNNKLETPKIKIEKYRNGTVKTNLSPRPQITHLKDDNKTLQVFGLAIYKHQHFELEYKEEVCSLGEIFGDCLFGQRKLETKIKEGREIKHARVELYNKESSNQVIRGFWNDTDGRYNYSWTSPTNRTINLGNGKWATGVGLPGDSQHLKIGEDIDYNQELCLRSVIFTDLPAGIQQVRVGGDCRRVVDRENFNIQDPISVNGSNSDKVRAEPRDGVDYDNITVNLKLLDGQEDYKNSYVKGKQVWIVTHGYDDQVLNKNKTELVKNNRFVQIAEEIKSVYGDDAIVMLLDWSDPADGKANSAGNTWNQNRDTCRAATWIKPTSQGVYNKLLEWGLTESDYSNLNLVGHSLGSIMITEISKRFGSKSNIGIALDPPSELMCTYSVQGEYNTWHIPGRGNEFTNGEYRSDFAGRFRFVRSYVGKNSVAGNQGFAKTADESLWFDYNKLTDTGGQHDWVVRSFKRIIQEIKLRSSPQSTPVLDIKDQNKHENWQKTYWGVCGISPTYFPCKKERFGGHSGSVRANETDDVRYLEVYIDGDLVRYNKN